MVKCGRDCGDGWCLLESGEGANLWRSGRGAAYLSARMSHSTLNVDDQLQTNSNGSVPSVYS